MRLAACALLPALLVVTASHAAVNGPAPAGPTANPQIEPAAYLRLSQHAMLHREPRRLPEDEFIRMARKPGVVVLDARSKEKYDALHVQGAVNLPFPDITIDSLHALLPDKDTVVLIYCNNNFRDAPDPMPTKLPPAALNLATYTALYTYGYRNVYELGPNLSVKDTRIPLEGPAAQKR